MKKQSKVIRNKIEVEIRNIIINEEEMMFAFEYSIKRSGIKKVLKGQYESDFSSQTASELRKTLENGYAAQLALEQLF